MDKRLQTHIEIDYKYRYTIFPVQQLLKEENGHIPGIDKILNDVWNSLDQEKLEKGIEQVVPLQTFFLGSWCRCRVRRVASLTDRTGGQTHVSYMLDSEKKLQNLEISVQIGGSGIVELKSEFKAILAHELLHNYEVWQKLQKTSQNPDYEGPRRQYNSLERPSYEFAVSLLRNPKSKIARIIGAILYCIYPNEQRAFIAQMRTELEKKADQLKTSRKATELVGNTRAWKNLQICKRNLSMLSQSSDSRVQEAVADICSTYFGKKNSFTFSQALKRLRFELDSFEQRILNVAGKICVELYESYSLKHFRGFIDMPLIQDDFMLEHLGED